MTSWFLRCCGCLYGSGPSNSANEPDAMRLETLQPEPPQPNQQPGQNEQHSLAQPEPNPQLLAAQGTWKLAPKQSGQPYTVQRAFPFMESYLDMWEVRTFLDNTLGVNRYNIKKEADRWILFANQDLTQDEIAELRRISGRVEPDKETEKRDSPSEVVREIVPNTTEPDTNNTEVAHSQSAVSEAHLENVVPSPGHGEGLEDPVEDTQPSKDALLSSNWDSVPQVPSFDRSSGAVTDSAPKTCTDGGRYYESAYLRGRYNPQRSSNGPAGTPPPRRDYTAGDKTILQQVFEDLTDDSAVVQSALNSKSQFVPCTVLNDIMSYETVFQILGECFSSNEWMAEDAQRIAPHDRSDWGLRRLFAILIIIKKHKDILYLLQFDTGLNDSYLPALDSTPETPTYEQEQLELFFTQQEWKPRDKKLFRQTQWELMPVFFGNEVGHDVHYQCRSGDVLPLVRHEGGIQKEGAFGQVTSYLLHKDQQSLKRYTTNGARHPVVVKKLYRLMSRDEFDEEVRVLRRLTRSRRGQNHHLAKLLATFEIPKNPGGATSTDYYMMFEWAEKTLYDLFREPRPSGRTYGQPQLHEWAAEQIHGLATALQAMHKLERAADDLDNKTRGIHGDLKPPNILMYKSWNYPESDGAGGSGVRSSVSRTRSDGLGVLQITDFGRSSFHHTLTAEDIKFAAIGGDYCPPELQLRLPVSPSLDIWTLGCLYLEILTWVLEGPEGIKEFQESRFETPGFLWETHSFFYSASGREDDEGTYISVSDTVLDWATRLYNSEHGSDFTRDLLKLVLECMLVIEGKSNARKFKSVPDRRPEGASNGRGRQRVDNPVGVSASNGISTKDFIDGPEASESPPTSETPPAPIGARQITRIQANELAERLQDIWDCRGGKKSRYTYFAKSAATETHDFYDLPRNAIYSPNSRTTLINEVKAEDTALKKKEGARIAALNLYGR